jgi:hypothetical protein
MKRNSVYNAKPKLRKTDLYLSVIQHEKIKKIAEEKGIAFSELFRMIVDRYLEEHEKRI